MEWTTHTLCGVVAGYAVTYDWMGAAAGGIAAQLSDIDEPDSHIGKPFFFLAYPIKRLFGHRTFTHSFLFALILGVALFPFIPHVLVYGAVAGVIAHILGDMLTGKVKVLFPYSKPLGLTVSRFSYIMTDRLTRLAMTVAVVSFIAVDFYQYVESGTL